MIRYRRYGDELILFELVNATTAEPANDNVVKPPPGDTKYKTIADYLAEAEAPLLDRYEALKSFLTSLGDDVQATTLKYYIAFKRIKNFACVEVHRTSGKIVVFVKLDPAQMQLQPGFTRDVRNVGHYGTGDLEITLKTKEDLEASKPLLVQSYEVS